MEHETIRGAIRYISKKPESFNQTRGFETFAFTRHPDGTVTMRAMSELEIPKPTVLRDMISTWSAEDRLVDASLRLTVGDAYLGSAWIRREGDELAMEAYGPKIGRVTQRIAYPSSFVELGMHPVVGDGYYCRHVSPKDGPNKQKLNLLVISPDHRGATAPFIVPVDLWIEYIGDETVTVAAGTFETHHYRYTDDGSSGLDGTHPDINLWVTSDGAYIYVKGEIGGTFLSSYELVSLKRTAPSTPG